MCNPCGGGGGGYTELKEGYDRRTFLGLKCGKYCFVVRSLFRGGGGTEGVGI